MLRRVIQLGLYAAAFVLAMAVAVVVMAWAWRISWRLIARTWPEPARRLRARWQRNEEA